MLAWDQNYLVAISQKQTYTVYDFVSHGQTEFENDYRWIKIDHLK